MPAASSYTGPMVFVGSPAVPQVGIVRLGGFWRGMPIPGPQDGYALLARYVDTTNVDLSMYQRGVPRGAETDAPMTFALVATVMRVVGPLQSGGVDVTLWEAETAGRGIGFTLPRRVWDLGHLEYVVGVRVEAVGATTLRPNNDFGIRDPTDSVDYDWMPWSGGTLAIYA